jgi:hypothetical protein
MTSDINERLISRIGNRGEQPSRPCAVALEPEVRTPIGFIPAAPVTDESRMNLPPITSAHAKGHLLSPFLFQWRYNVRYEDIHAFHDWLTAYEPRLQEIGPWHFSYLGTHASALGANGNTGSGQYSTLWLHGHQGSVLHLTFGADERKHIIDTEGEKEFRQREDEYLRLLRELISFQDESSPARESQLYQLATNIGRV